MDTKRLITVDFAATVGGEPGGGLKMTSGALCDSKVHTSLPWEFVPQQRRVVVGLGEPTGKEGCFLLSRAMYCNCL